MTDEHYTTIAETRRRLRDELRAMDVAAQPEEAIDLVLSPLDGLLAIVEELRQQAVQLIVETDELKQRSATALKRSQASLYEAQAAMLSAQREAVSGQAKVLRSELLEHEVNELLRDNGYEYPLGMRGLRDMAGHLKLAHGFANDLRHLIDTITEIIGAEKLEPAEKIAEIAAKIQGYEREH